MKRTVYLGIGDGGLWLALVGEPIPKGATVLEPKEGKFWLRQAVPPMAHPTILHAVSEIADASGYPFHGAAAFADLPFVMDALAEAIDQRRLFAYRNVSLEGGGKGPAPQPQPGPKPQPPAPSPVNPLIDPPVLVVVVQKKAKNPKSGAEEPYTHPKRQSFTLKTDAAFEGTATFTCDKADKVKFFSAEKGGTEIKFDGTANVWKPKSAPAWAPKGSTISSGATVWVEAQKPSDKKEDITVKLELSGGPKPVGGPDTSKITSVELTLDIHKSKPDAASAPALSKDDKVFVGRNLLVQDKANHFLRGKLVIQQVKPSDFEGDLVLKAKDGRVDAFKDEDATKAGQASSLPFTIKANKVPGAGEVLWAQGAKASDKVMDTGFVLGIKGVEDEGDRVTVTAVELKLDICKSRTKKGVLPDPMSEEDKVKVGRFVHEQDTGSHHGRAVLIVRKVKPEKFQGKLRLESVPGGKTELFDKELAKDGGSLVAVPKDFDLASEKNEDKKLFVQGKTVSGALVDAGYFLHLEEDPPKNADKVAVTVCKLSNLKAVIPSTPANTNRLGNSPVATHDFEIGTGPVADDYDVDPAKNKPLVLLEGAVAADADPTQLIQLTVKVAPAGVPVRWSRQRDERPGKGDHAKVIKLSPNPLPKLDEKVGKPLEATLLTDAVGTFHIRPFVDNNGNAKFDDGVDIEPYLLMNVVMVGVRIHQDLSATHATLRGVSDGAGGIGVSGGVFNINTPNLAAIHMIAVANVTAGGPVGRTGMDQIEAGWINNETANENIVGTFADALGNVRSCRSVFASNFAAATGASATGSAFIPGNPAPVLVAPPLLDSGALGAGGGGNTACLTRSRVRAPIPDLAVGKRFTIEAVDSPGDGENQNHPGFPAARLNRFHFGLTFGANLSFWSKQANRLYAVLQSLTWTMDAEWTLHPVTGALTVVTAPVVAIGARPTFSPMHRAKDVGVEVRPPTGLSLIVRDARA